MNENIENCLYQAGLTAQGCWDELDDYAREGIEKFALLIVRECVTRLEQHHPFTKDPEAYLYAISLIEEHFGVE